MSIKIIGAGFPRTGTNTLKQALEILGFQKTYHFKELLNHPSNIQHWKNLQENNTMDWDSIYNGYQATVDFPAYAWYKQHMQKYPSAKIILTKRPFEEWYASVKMTLYTTQAISTEELSEQSKESFDTRLQLIEECRNFVRHYLWKIQFEDSFLERQRAEEIWSQHLEEVMAHVPKEKLLVYDVSEGWAPLCKFLGLNVPDISFPHLNKKEDFKKMMENFMKGEKL